MNQPTAGTMAPDAFRAHAGAGFLTNTGINLIGLTISALVSMANEVLAARFLGIASYGLYGLAIMLTRVGEKVAVFGVPVSVMRYLPVHLSRGERRDALGTILSGIPVAVALGLMLALTLGLGSGWVALHVFDQPALGRWIAILAVGIPMLAVIDLLANVSRGFGQALPPIIFRNLAPQLCVMGILIWLLISGGPQLGTAYGQLCGLGLGVVLACLAVLRLVQSRVGWVRPILRLRRLYGYALPVALNSLVSLAMGGTDLFLLNLFTTADTVGNYRGCMQIVLIFDLIFNAFEAATAMVYSVLIADGQQSQLQQSYLVAGSMGMALATPVLLVIAVNGSDLLGLLGPAFTAGAIPLVVLAFGQYTKVALGAASIVLNVGGRQALDAGNVALAAAFNLALNLTLIPRYGLLGASLATATAMIALGVLRCVQLRRMFGLRTYHMAMVRVVLATAPVAAAVWGGSVLLGVGPGSGLGFLLARLVVMGLLFGGGYWLFCLSPADRKMLCARAGRGV